MKRYCAVLIGGIAGLSLAWCSWAQSTDGIGAGGMPPPMGEDGGRPGMHGKQLRGGPGGEAPEGAIARFIMNAKLAEEIGLTKEQVTSLRTTLDEMKKKEIDLRAEQEKGGIDQAKLMSETTLDEKAIMAAVEKSGKINIELAKLRVQQLLVIRKTLTAEQMEKVKAMIHQRMNKMKEEGGSRPWKGRKGKGEDSSDHSAGNPEHPENSAPSGD